jgi:hypothetical protein
MTAKTPNTAPPSLPRLRHIRYADMQRFIYTQRLAERRVLSAVGFIVSLTVALWEILTTFDAVLPLPIAAVLIALILAVLYVSAAELLNRVAITANATHLKITCRPLPMPNHISAPLNSIAIIDYRVIPNEGVEAHRVIAVLRNRDEFEILRTGDANIAQRVALELERHRRLTRPAAAGSDLRSA